MGGGVKYVLIFHFLPSLSHLQNWGLNIPRLPMLPLLPFNFPPTRPKCFSSIRFNLLKSCTKDLGLWHLEARNLGGLVVKYLTSSTYEISQSITANSSPTNCNQTSDRKKNIARNLLLSTKTALTLLARHKERQRADRKFIPPTADNFCTAQLTTV